MVEYEWDRTVGAVVWGRARAGLLFGLPLEELMNIGRMAAHLSEKSWDPCGARSKHGWIRDHIEYEVRKALIAAGRYAVEEDELGDDSVVIDDIEARCLVSESLGYLQARLASAEWVLLWLKHAEGWSHRELGEKWGITEASMKDKLHRLKNKALTILEKAA